MVERNAGVRNAGRLAFAVIWVGVQAVLVITSARRVDGAFGFRMFNESSSLKVTLYRDVVGSGEASERRLRVEGGAWNARDTSGRMRRFKWAERVTRPELSAFDAEVAAPHGTRAQLERWKAAVDDVAAHATEDAETKRLVLEVTVRRNGHEPVVVELASPERALTRVPGGG